ncbi:MAG: MATE family efflux transporter [Desulfovibrionaceae bacterium]
MTGRWSMHNGYRDVLRVALPLIVSMGASSLMFFTDRLFLSAYSLDAIAAALPAGIASFLFMSFFMGTAGYVNVFIAQYTGAGQPERVASSLWQGIWFCLGSWVAMALLWFAAEPLFALVGHSPAVQALEVAYFQVLSLGAGIGVLAVALSSFYSGRGLTRPVMVVNLAGAALNIPLDYALINGAWGAPEMGIVGAGCATVLGWCFSTLVFALLIFRRSNNLRYGMRAAWRLDRVLFGRLLRYGLPGGVEFFIDIFAFTFFVLTMGRIGFVELAATNIAVSINGLTFLPMIGMHVALSTLMGQSIGRGTPEEGAQAVTSALHMTMAYMAVVCLVFVFFPDWLLECFRQRGGGGADFAAVKEQGMVLLRMLALYTLFDGFSIVYFGALKGAGDTLWCMWAMAGVSLSLLVVPVFVCVEWFHSSVYVAWTWMLAYSLGLGSASMWRYRRGRWRGMRVIESAS